MKKINAISLAVLILINIFTLLSCEKSIRKVPVSSEEWNEAVFGEYLNNCTVKFTQSVGLEGGIGEEETFIIKCTEIAILQGEDEYTVKKDGKFYSLRKEHDDYVGDLVDEAYFESFKIQYITKAFKDKYALFEYDKENDCFLAKNIEVDGDTCYVKLYFDVLKLFKITVELTDKENTVITTQIEISNIGETEVNAPHFKVK